MTKLQASMKDANYKKSAKERMNMKKVGSTFRGCLRCGQWEMRERHVRSECGSHIETKEYKHWYIGTNVYEAYSPVVMGWSFWCWDCGAKDDLCWAKGEPKQQQSSLREKDLKIMELEAKIKKMMESLQK